MNIFLINLFIFIIGACFGSFISVIIYRSIKHENGIIAGHSKCPSCKKKLKFYHLIPIVSFLFLGGKCAYCRKKISPAYFLLEILSGMLFLTNFNLLIYGFQQNDFTLIFQDWYFWAQFIYLNILSLIILAIAFADLEKKAIPANFLYFWIFLSILSLTFNNNSLLTIVINQGIAILAALLFFGGQYLLSQGRWLGSGDIYFAVGMAILLGLQKFTLAVITSYLIGSLIVVLLFLFKQVKRKQKLPFTPFLIMGTLISLYFGNQIINWYLHSFLILNFASV